MKLGEVERFVFKKQLCKVLLYIKYLQSAHSQSVTQKMWQKHSYTRFTL